MSFKDRDACIAAGGLFDEVNGVGSDLVQLEEMRMPRRADVVILGDGELEPPLTHVHDVGG